jgi:hypothetical protein
VPRRGDGAGDCNKEPTTRDNWKEVCWESKRCLVGGGNILFGRFREGHLLCHMLVASSLLPYRLQNQGNTILATNSSGVSGFVAGGLEEELAIPGLRLETAAIMGNLNSSTKLQLCYIDC